MSFPYLNRELSWLEFNQRVLNEATKESLPLLERVKFLAITAANLDEFFQVRVGSLLLMRRNGINKPEPSGLTPIQQLTQIRRRVDQMLQDQYSLLNDELLPKLQHEGIHFLKPTDWTSKQSDFLAAFFESNIQPLLTPLAVEIDSHGEISAIELPSLQPIVACRVDDAETKSSRFVLIPIPESLSRRVSVPTQNENEYAFSWVEDLVSAKASLFFPGEIVAATMVFRLTRNGDVTLQEEDSVDLADDMEEVLAARKIAGSVRLEIPVRAPKELAQIVQQITGSTSYELFRVAGPVGLSGLMELAFLPNYDALRNEEWAPQSCPAISPGESMFEAISREDILLHHPYESFEPVLRLIEEAAVDADVVAIKQVLYRTAKQSRIIDALIKAAENGKSVTVLVELKARFDEARNLHRADELRQAGAQIVYGVKGLKTHAKILMIVRKEKGQFRRYLHLGTGNYNEATAKIYTDLSYLSCKPEYGIDASFLFNAITGRSKLMHFQKLVPAPTAMKPKLLGLIADEAERAKQGGQARIIAKMNSLQDPEIINALYQASKAGVKIQMNIRGICCLKPRDAEWSKNIEVISVIDRYLEHTRAFYFHQGGDPEVFIASADWMGRNLDRRIELMIPIEEPALQRRIVKILETFFTDNQNAWRLLADGTSEKVNATKKSQKALRSQAEFFLQAKNIAKAREHERAMTFEPHVPAN